MKIKYKRLKRENNQLWVAARMTIFRIRAKMLKLIIKLLYKVQSVYKAKRHYLKTLRKVLRKIKMNKN